MPDLHPFGVEIRERYMRERGGFLKQQIPFDQNNCSSGGGICVALSFLWLSKFHTTTHEGIEASSQKTFNNDFWDVHTERVRDEKTQREIELERRQINENALRVAMFTQERSRERVEGNWSTEIHTFNRTMGDAVNYFGFSIEGDPNDSMQMYTSGGYHTGIRGILPILGEEGGSSSSQRPINDIIGDLRNRTCATILMKPRDESVGHAIAMGYKIIEDRSERNGVLKGNLHKVSIFDPNHGEMIFAFRDNDMESGFYAVQGWLTDYINYFGKTQTFDALPHDIEESVLKENLERGYIRQGQTDRGEDENSYYHDEENWRRFKVISFKPPEDILELDTKFNDLLREVPEARLDGEKDEEEKLVEESTMSQVSMLPPKNPSEGKDGAVVPGPQAKEIFMRREEDEGRIIRNIAPSKDPYTEIQRGILDKNMSFEEEDVLNEEDNELERSQEKNSSSKV